MMAEAGTLSYRQPPSEEGGGPLALTASLPCVKGGGQIIISSATPKINIDFTATKV